MLFKPELAILIVQQEKTETRRKRKKGEALVERDGNKTVLTIGGRIKYQVGRTYAVQYGYGKPTCLWRLFDDVTPMIMPYLVWLDIHNSWKDDAIDMLEHKGYQPLRIKLLDIHSEDVRDISESSAIADGFKDQYVFWKTWCGFYDPNALNHFNEDTPALDQAQAYLMYMDDYKYKAWALTFELVK